MRVRAWVNKWQSLVVWVMIRPSKPSVWAMRSIPRAVSTTTTRFARSQDDPQTLSPGRHQGQWSSGWCCSPWSPRRGRAPRLGCLSSQRSPASARRECPNKTPCPPLFHLSTNVSQTLKPLKFASHHSLGWSTSQWGYPCEWSWTCLAEVSARAAQGRQGTPRAPCSRCTGCRRGRTPARSRRRGRSPRRWCPPARPPWLGSSSPGSQQCTCSRWWENWKEESLEMLTPTYG